MVARSQYRKPASTVNVSACVSNATSEARFCNEINSSSLSAIDLEECLEPNALTFEDFLTKAYNA
ncbi:hypothetical protein GCM10011405_28930 [Rufibacter glacialis]|nr:hypothetical protein GCM10011405_28930 [Rufibacter glacialis]